MKNVAGNTLARVRRTIVKAVLAPLHLKHAFAGRGLPLTINERRLLNLRDHYSGRRCVIIGGGPSLKKMRLDRLADEITFCVNGFYHLFNTVGFVPTFYVVEDRLVAEDNRKNINEIRGITKIFPEDLRYCLRASDETIFVRFDRFYDNPDAPGIDFPHFVDSHLHFFWGGTVSYLCLQLAYFMGFAEVYLIGMDMNYAVPSTMSARKVITSSSDDVNHVHPAWFGPGKRWHDPQTDRMNLAFDRAKTVFESAGRRVLNATVGGNLHVFDRVDFNEVFR